MAFSHWHRKTSAKPQHVSGAAVTLSTICMILHINNGKKNIRNANLILPVACQEVFCDVCRQDILQQNPVEILHGFNLLALFLELVLPQKV